MRDPLEIDTAAAEALATAGVMLDAIGHLVEVLLAQGASSDSPFVEAILACVEKAERAVVSAQAALAGSGEMADA